MSDLWLEGPLTSAAYGWRLERRDGVTLGFTSHDHDVEIDRLLHKAVPGMMPSSITESLGLHVDGLDVRGALTADAVREDDLQAGRWDGARLSIYLFDWNNPSLGKRLLASGELGGITHSVSRFEAEFKGPASKLDRAVAPYCSPACRADFCGSACGLNAMRFRHELPIAAINYDIVSFASPLPAEPNAFAFGELRWLDGANCGFQSEIISNDVHSIRLTAPPTFAATAGNRVHLLEGCDKTIATCASRFGNAINFRGEPHLPGNDILTRYPGAS